MTRRLTLLALPAMLLGVSSARADFYFFQYSGAGVTASGVLTTAASPLVAGGYLVTGLTGTLNSPDLSGAMTLVTPQQGNPGVPGDQNTSPSGLFYYDDLLFPGDPTNPFDNDGLLFTVSGAEVNVYGAGGSGVGSGVGSQVIHYEQNGAGGGWGFNTPVTFGLLTPVTSSNYNGSPTPEPGFYGMTALGLVGLVLLRRRRRAA